MLDAADEAGGQTLRRARELDGSESGNELLEQHSNLHARQRRTQAEVLTDAEAQVRVRVAVDTEPEGVIEDLLVPIGLLLLAAETGPKRAEQRDREREQAITAAASLRDPVVRYNAVGP